MIKMSNNYRMLIYYLGVFIMLIGGIILLPLVVLPFYRDEVNLAYCFLLPGSSSILIGYLIIYFFKGDIKNLEKHQDALLVVLVWLVAIFISAFPFMLQGDYNFIQALFESTSGYTTTGLSVVDVENCSHIFLFYRSILLFIGGVGFVLILTSALSDKLSLRLYNAEGHNDKLLPNLAKSARLIFSIYLFYIFIGTIFYVIFKMPLFDAINHSIAAISTGGFSTRGGGIYEFHSPSIEIVTIILMLLGSTNFVVHLYLLRGKFKNVLKHSETKFFIFFSVVTLALSFLIFNLMSKDKLSFLEILFQYVSCLSTTGFQNVDSMRSLPCGFISLMILLMLIGGQIGSTSGGLKQYRLIGAFKAIKTSLHESMSNRKVIRTVYVNKCGKDYELDKKEMNEHLVFVLLYLLIFFVGSFIISCYGFNFQDAMFEFSSSLSTVGLSVGIAGYNAPSGILITSIIGMLLGRLELIVVFQAFIKLYCDIRGKEVI